MSSSPNAPRFQFGIVDLLLSMVAIGFWLTCSALLATNLVSRGLVLVVFAGITCAISVLLRNWRHAWPWAAILAPWIAVGCLFAVWLFVNN